MRTSYKNLLVTAATVTLSVSAVAQTKWNMATPYPQSEFHTRNIQQFATKVDTLSGGELKITVHSAQSLFKHPEIPRAVRTGQVEMGETIMSNLANQSPIF